MSPAFSPPACRAACARFTPNESGQRSPPTSYRGCWHVVSRGFFCGYRHASSPPKAVYGPGAFVPHAASLRQGSPHCAIFPTAASRRSLGRVSVPMRPSGLSARLPVVATVGRHPAVWLMGRGPIPLRLSFPGGGMRSRRGVRHYPRFPAAIPVRGAGCPRVTRPFAASCAFRRRPSSLDLHVLGAPPAFVLSQDRTLRPGPRKGASDPKGKEREKKKSLKSSGRRALPGPPARLSLNSPASLRSIRLSRSSAAPGGAARGSTIRGFSLCVNFGFQSTVYTQKRATAHRCQPTVSIARSDRGL